MENCDRLILNLGMRLLSVGFRSIDCHTPLLPIWYDVDDAESFARLWADLRLAAPNIAPRTRAFLAEQLSTILPPYHLSNE